MSRLRTLALISLTTACSSSPVQPTTELLAETVGTEFTLSDRRVEVPFSAVNTSADATRYVWLGPGGVCVSVERLGSLGWRQLGNGACYPASALALAPGERVDGEVTFYDFVGTFRLRVHTSDRADQSGYESGGRPGAPTNAFKIRPGG